MTARLAALRALLHVRAEGHEAARAAFEAEFIEHPLVTDKWIALVATRPHPDALVDIEALLAGPHWLPTNPNRVRALIGSVARSNPMVFHRVDGAGYRFVVAQALALDAINPQVAARLLGAFEGLPRWSVPAQAQARAALTPMREGLRSRDVAEVLARLEPEPRAQSAAARPA